MLEFSKDQVGVLGVDTGGNLILNHFHCPKSQDFKAPKLRNKTKQMGEYTINCVLHTGQRFSVMSLKNSSMTRFKEDIKKLTPLLDEFFPLQLTLYMVKLDGSKDCTEQVKQLIQDRASLQEAPPLSMLSMIFPEQPDLSLQKVLILVVPPLCESLDPRMWNVADVFVPPASPPCSTP